MTSSLLRPPVGRPLVARLRFQLPAVALASFFVPLVMPLITAGALTTNLSGTWNSQIASLVAALIALLAFRRLTIYPGTQGSAYILPAFSSTFGVAVAVLLASRVSYSGTMMLAGYLASFGITYLIWYLGQRAAPTRMYFVPNGNVDLVTDVEEVQWVPLLEPVEPPEPEAAIVADLHAEHEPAWEHMLAAAAISGRPVYHTKQLHESLTGRVQIERLSENSFGSLLPNMAYRGFKRAVDLFACLVMLPILAIPMVLVAVAIRLDSPGPAFFRQERMGYRGRPFRVVKFRTMLVRPEGEAADGVRSSITLSDDARITRLGRFLRRSRIDELPQLLNVLRGEMSWIGPRPEALSLSSWYESELPFYVYRHIVRPGITGWAQVNQGHVAELEDVHVKLHYDFYYIKYFSAWLDFLIAMRTVVTMLTGSGAK